MPAELQLPRSDSTEPPPPVGLQSACPRTGRLPLPRAGRWCHSFHAATLNEGCIQRWWGQHPEYGIGVSCGPAGLVVIDIGAHGSELPVQDRTR
ncbi:bifunctional DNA primase/polymerase [Streptomyces viridochromogenes]|uniref:bifunctional DNA primase/polymerase n=1 Tax=Streptomyces viridochromogenes TaxID=1938 RepID=UPI0030B8EC1F